MPELLHTTRKAWTWKRWFIAAQQFVLYTFAHKYYVLRAGWWTRAPLWRLLIHDWSKFTPTEFRGYVRQFYGDKGDARAWRRAWLHHQNSNPHHWEYWIVRGPNSFTALVMPDWAVREMVADWMAMARMLNGQWPMISDWPWLESNMAMLQEHIEPEAWVATLGLIARVCDSLEPRRVSKLYRPLDA